MNKVLLMPIFIMIILVLLGTVSELSTNPADDGISSVPNGQWITGSMGQWGWLPAEHSDDKSYAYPALGTGDWLNLYFNPSLPENQHKSFSIFNMDTAEYEYYDNYAEFNEKYGSGSSTVNFGVEDIFDTGSFWLIIAGVLTAGTVLGVAIFGSGLSEWAQRMVFIAGGYGALWLFLSAGITSILLDSVLSIFGTMLYVGLTITFIIGVIIETSSGGD